MSAPTVTSVAEASPAARAGLAVGDELLSLNGQEPRDVIDFQQLCDADDLKVLVKRAGADLPRLVKIDKSPGEPFGVEVSSAVFDRIRTCDNHCAFCFIYQLPKGMRKSLYLKDDDYRLSFLYGNFTTLTRFTELDAERILTERLGPLFVSIHSTNPELRSSMLRNPKGATSLRWLSVLLDGDIEVHGQIVVCPGVNDGLELEDTLAGILDQYPKLASVGVVPLGISQFSNEADMRPHTTEEAAFVVDTVGEWQKIYQRTLGRRLAYVADEYYLLAERPFPSARVYDEYPQHENGIGMARAFINGFTRPEQGGPGGVRHGFFASVDAAPAEGYRALRLLQPTGAAPGTGPDQRPVVVLTGTYGARILGPLLEEHPRDDVTVREIPNDFFGGNIGVAGLLTGEDIARTLSESPAGPRYLLPDACLNEGRFLDGLTLADLPQAVEVVPTDGASLRAALDGKSFRVGCRGMSTDARPENEDVTDDLIEAEFDEQFDEDLDDEFETDAETESDDTPAKDAPRIGLPMVVVAGRPNVGKSSLVNRIVGERAAVVEEEAGVTRDRKVLTAEWIGVPFNIMDTGGWLAGGDALDAKVSQQAEVALSEADVILLVVDVNVGLTDEDVSAAKVIRRAGPPVVLVVNKVDDTNREAAAWEFVSLGVGDPHMMTALHGRGTGDMLDTVVDLLPPPVLTEEEEAADERAQRTGPGGTPRVAIIGRPNVGKSTLFNKLIGEERSIVHDMPGTTRDAIDTIVETVDGPVCFIDTAGLRRPSRTERGTEHHAVLRALRALEKADIAMLVIDATIGASHQDQRLAERIGVSGCPAIVVLNKWDLIDVDDRDDVLAGVGDRLAFLGSAPVLKMSARSGKGVQRILPALRDSVEAYHQRVPTGALNRAMQELQLRQSAPRARIRYIVQGAIDPPTFTLFTNGKLPQTYIRYIERGLREKFEFGATPMKLRVRIGGK